MQNCEIENIQILLGVNDKPIWSASMNGQPIIIKKYVSNSLLKKTVSEKNAHITKEITNEVCMLKYIEKSIKFPEGIKVPKSLAVYLEQQVDENKIIEAFQCIEKLPGQDLFDWMDINLKLEYDEKHQILRKITERVALAIYILHKNNVIHGDIKLDNTMIDVSPSGEINLGLIDFVFSQLVDINNVTLINNKKCAREFNIFSGTVDYISPELFFGTPYNLFANDVWGFAMTIFTLYTGYFVGRIDKKYNTVKKQITISRKYCECSFKEKDLPEDIYKLLCLIFVKEEERISMEEVIKYLGIDLMDFYE